MNVAAVALMSIALSVAAQFAMKAGMSGPGTKAALNEPFALGTVWTVLSNGYVVGGFLLYGIGAVFWLRVLGAWDVSKAYPMVGLGFALTAIIGSMIGEQVTPSRAVGVALICAGVYLTGRS